MSEPLVFMGVGAIWCMVVLLGLLAEGLGENVWAEEDQAKRSFWRWILIGFPAAAVIGAVGGFLVWTAAGIL